MITYDLHLHTTASDGIFSPSQVVEKAVERGLKGIAITDHDTVAGVREAMVYARKHHPEFVVIPGIELNTNFEKQSVHVLGYHLDYQSDELEKRLNRLRSWREERAAAIVEKLQKLGYEIDYEEVRKKAGGSVGRPHIARVLKEKGRIPSEQWAFDHLISRGKPAYVPRHPFTPFDGAELIHQVGGVVVLAHPGLIENQKRVTEFLDHQPPCFDGVEVHYPAHQLYQVEKYRKQAHERGLFITGGSDFHGEGTPEHAGYIGFRGVNDETYAVFDERQKCLRQSFAIEK